MRITCIPANINVIYTCICMSIREYGSELFFFSSTYVSETLLQAIGKIINVVGEKVKETVVNDLKLTLVMLLQASQVSKHAMHIFIQIYL